MKRYIVIVALLISASLAVQAQQFDLKGTISGQNGGYLHLYYQNNENKTVKDSCAINNGSFEFKGNITEPTMAFFIGAAKSNSYGDPNSTAFFIEPTTMQISVAANDFQNAVITGSKTQDEAAALQKQKEPILEKKKSWEQSHKEAEDKYDAAVKNKESNKVINDLKDKVAAIQDQYEPYGKKIAAIDFAYFDGYPNSYLTTWQLRFYTSSLKVDSLQLFYSRMNAQLQQSHYGKYLANQIANLRAGTPGSIAADFIATDLNGKSISISSFKGKYIILDFWASWCIPCRQSNPHMLQLYKKYHEKGLEIIGVANDDNNHAAWKKAVATDGVGVWYNVLCGIDLEKIKNNEKNENDINEKFGIHSLPTKIIIDPSGKIVGRYDDNFGGTEEDMDKLLASVFNK
ncbi:MAG: hypothetical protein JWR09_1601 [Mucilaginibacter sp.]|nr:hypothetical protein [Mucilaginibacter sp.]